MMQAIRDAITGWLAYAVIAVLIIPFAFWGVGDYFGFFGDNYAAKVNDVEIPLQRYRVEYNQRYAQTRDAYGDQFDPDFIDEAALRQRVLDEMIEAEVLYQYARERGYRVSDEQIVERIHTVPAFQEDGVFSSERYRYLLQMNGLTPSQFEADMRRSMVLAQFQGGVVDSAFLPEAMIESIVRIVEQRREFAWAEVPAAEFRDGIEVTEEQVAEYYERNARRFMTDERVDLEYVVLGTEALAGRIEVNEDELRAFYEERAQQIGATEERRARHIMVEDESAAAELKARLDAGEDFAALAAEHSVDTDTAADGGDLGWVGRDFFMPELEEAIYSLDEGAVSEPVRTGFGWHLVRVDEIRAGEEREPFEAVRDELADEFRTREVERRFYDMVERLADLAFENPDSLVPAADTLELEIGRIEGVTRGQGDGLAADARVRNAAFSPEVLEERYNSRLLELDDDRVAVVRVAAHEPPRQRELEEVADRIREVLVRERARERAAEVAETLVERARGGEALADLAREFSAVWHAPRTVSRGSQDVPPPVTAAVFRAPRPDSEAPVIRTVQVGDDIAVFQLLAVNAGTGADMDAEQRANIVRVLSRRDGEAQFQALMESLKAEADIKYGSNLFEDPAGF